MLPVSAVQTWSQSTLQQKGKIREGKSETPIFFVWRTTRGRKDGCLR